MGRPSQANPQPFVPRRHASARPANPNEGLPRASMRLDWGEVQILLDATHALHELADQDAMADGGGMIFDAGAGQPDDLVGQIPSDARLLNMTLRSGRVVRRRR